MCDLLVYVLSVPLCYSNCYYTKSVLLIMLNKIQFNSIQFKKKSQVHVDFGSPQFIAMGTYSDEVLSYTVKKLTNFLLLTL